MSNGWTATSAKINALPECVREWVHELETRCDPAGDLRARRMAEDKVRDLRATCVNAAASLAICHISRPDRASDNLEIIAIVLDSLRAAIAKAQHKGPTT